MVLRSFFDGGNQADSRVYDVVSLASVSGTKDEWKPFEKDWKRALTKHKADYLHTTDAVARKGIYEGWSERQRDSFLRDCVRIACKHSARATVGDAPGKFGVFTHVISIVLKDFVEYRKQNPKSCQNANEACVRQTLAQVLDWADNQAACDECHFFFDQGEPFYGHVCQLLQNKKAMASAKWLEKMRHRTESDMRDVPALQLADLYAWCQTNRNDPWNPTWKVKLLSSHFRWSWIDKTNVGEINWDQQEAWLSWNMPKRAPTN